MGETKITITVHQPVATIVCNAVDLEVLKAWVVNAEGLRIDATASVDVTTERVTFTLPQTLYPGAATLHAQFHGTLNDKLNGFYASTYQAEDGTTKVIATTQMESTDARKAFPCWDEPDAKAVWAITLVVDDGLMAVSNMHELSNAVLASGKRSIRFADTPVMSSYLVAMVVGELEATDPIDVDGIPLRVISRPGTLDQSAFALESGAFALRYFQSWYDIPYPGTKLDLIATPDFAFGAMENLGAVTFRESLLLVDETRSSRIELERIADVISHEIAHMWFGDLVTMKWWDGIWLNEAFATFAEVSCCAKFRPEWDRWTSFSQFRTAAQEVDALHSTRAIEFPVISPSDAEGMFDVLTYEKGASILRMLEQYLGEEPFRDGVRHYLRTHSFSNTETSDLWDAIEESTGEPVREIMDGWILQGGYPVVDVALDPAANTATLSQRRFVYQSLDTPTTWRIPVLYRTNDGTLGRVLLGTELQRLAIPPGTTAIVANAGGHGFYRVSYNETALQALKEVLPTLSAVERYQLAADAWATVVSGDSNAATFLEFTQAFASERSPSVWTTLIGGFSELRRIAGPTTKRAIAERVRALLGPLVAELGWEAKPAETDIEGELRGQLIRALGELGEDEATNAKAADAIDGLLAGNSNVDPDVAPAVVVLAARRGDLALYNRYLNAKDNAKTPPEQRRFLLGLAQFTEPSLAQTTLANTLNGVIRTQDGPFVITSMLAQRDNGHATWAFMRDNWAALNEKFPSNLMPRIVDGVRALSDTETANEIAEFFTNGPGKELAARSKPVLQHLERLKVNNALRVREALP
jgi:puromycin-sensitive aminopeptidase